MTIEMPLRTIVFGPTGNVGSITSRIAHERGAKVFLAMRNVTKPIPGHSAAQEQRGQFQRVQADLTQPSTIISALQQTQATSAFIYLAHSADDHMKATIETLKAAGVTFVVFLSSFTIQEPLKAIPPHHRIPYIHARVEMNLEQVFGPKNYVALRAGAFATNTLRWKSGIASRGFQLDNPEVQYDYITPVDMGRVAGHFLAKGSHDGQNIVYLYGPKLISQKQAVEIVGQSLGNTVDFVRVDSTAPSNEGPSDDQSGKRVRVRLGPEETRSEWFHKAYANIENGILNVEKYGGRPATGYEAWVNESISRFKS